MEKFGGGRRQTGDEGDPVAGEDADYIGQGRITLGGQGDIFLETGQEDSRCGEAAGRRLAVKHRSPRADGGFAHPSGCLNNRYHWCFGLDSTMVQ